MKLRNVFYLNSVFVHVDDETSENNFEMPQHTFTLTHQLVHRSIDLK